MDGSVPVPSPTASTEADAVRVTVRVERPAADAWAALWDPVRLGAWFGSLDRPWLVGREARIDFGDGDFFVVVPSGVREGRLIEFEWSFLGVGPRERIRWTVTTTQDGTEVAVEDRCPGRRPAEAAELADGWCDFFGRLAAYLVTGERSRYRWRADIDGSVVLPPGSVVPLELETLYRWLPVASDGFAPRWFFVVDEEGPRRFRLHDWNLRGDRFLTFSVEIPGSAARTSCTVAVERHGDRHGDAAGPAYAAGPGTRVRFSHTGWADLGLPDGRGRALRHRFAGSWVEAIERLQDLAGGSEASVSSK